MVKKTNGERGNLVIEASFVVTLSLIFVAILINIGFVVYEKMLMDAAATQAATGAASVYASTYRDPVYGYIDQAEFYKTDLYRYVVDFFNNSHDESGMRKAKWLALFSLKSRQIRKHDEPVIHVEIINKPGTVLQHQVVVSITEQFDMPLAAVFNGNKKITYTAVGRADCIDLLDYFNTVSMLHSELGGMIDKLLAHFNKFIGIFSLE